MAHLSADIKLYIVQALACFDTPSQVSTAVQERYGVTVYRQQIEMHDLAKRSSKGLARKWRILFEATRDAFNSAMQDIPIANRSYRLRVLGRLFVHAEQAGNLALASTLLEQAAREMGMAPPAPRG